MVRAKAAIRPAKERDNWVGACEHGQRKDTEFTGRFHAGLALGCLYQRRRRAEADVLKFFGIR
jgi:hypothetical protein